MYRKIVTLISNSDFDEEILINTPTLCRTKIWLCIKQFNKKYCPLWEENFLQRIFYETYRRNIFIFKGKECFDSQNKIIQIQIFLIFI